MKNKSCPVSFVSIDGNITRISSFYFGLIFSAYLFTMYDTIVYLLIIDFIVRLFIGQKYSLLVILATQTKNILHIKEHLVDSAAKRLAATFGLLFLVIISIASVLGLDMLLYVSSVILLACIIMEVTIAYCVGCEVYYLLKYIF